MAFSDGEFVFDCEQRALWPETITFFDTSYSPIGVSNFDAAQPRVPPAGSALGRIVGAVCDTVDGLDVLNADDPVSAGTLLD